MYDASVAVTMIRVSPETRAAINEIARNDYGGVSADEALRRLAREHRRAVWIEQARQLREEQPEDWEAAGAELVDLAEATIGDGLADQPWDDQP
jgi:multidrug resistance efflux pump